MGPVPEEPCSPFMRHLQAQAENFQSEIVGPFACERLSQPRLQRLIARLFTLFVRRACLLPAASSHGRLRLASDLARLEVVAQAFNVNVTTVGPAYPALRALRPLLFLEDASPVERFASLSQNLPFRFVVG